MILLLMQVLDQSRTSYVVSLQPNSTNGTKVFYTSSVHSQLYSHYLVTMTATDVLKAAEI